MYNNSITSPHEVSHNVMRNKDNQSFWNRQGTAQQVFSALRSLENFKSGKTGYDRLRSLSSLVATLYGGK